VQGRTKIASYDGARAFIEMLFLISSLLHQNVDA